ncbi:MAG: LysM peptidoglycan-binding domain-containing protein [Betaproteobacteria bacterium]|nr:LysM peptidoglycan-binding domain-containing protein [Betaproteobacteria bacterium]
MRKPIIAVVLSSLCAATTLATLPARAQALAENAPNSYTVVKGDTLWGIAGKFLKEPWRWPEIWNMNQDQIKDPHWIYPGDVIKLEMTADGKPRLSLDGTSMAGSVQADGTVRVSPKVRTEKLRQAIPSIPGAAIAPLLTQPLVQDEKGLSDAPKIVATEDSRVIVGAGNRVYVDHLDPSEGVRWQVYRQGNPIVDPDTKEVLGYEAIYIAEARVSAFGTPSTLEVTKSAQEINRGDRLTPVRETAIPSYSPRAPETKIQGKIIGLSQGVAEAGQYSVVTLNRGKRDGLVVGHVLATYRFGEVVPTDEDGFAARLKGMLPNYVVPDAVVTSADPRTKVRTEREVKLPNERSGLVFVFRVFDRVSYGLIMQTRRPVYINDVVQTP